jgi:uncharacterized Zn finger protein
MTPVAEAADETNRIAKAQNAEVFTVWASSLCFGFLF